jgi:sulfotransferase family protein
MGLYRTLRTRAARAGLHRPVGWLRNFGIDPNDVLLASHGRSGSSMLRFILAEILSGVPSTFDTIQRIVPEVGLQFHTYPTLPGSGRLIKTHEPYCREYKRAIYIVRDVRDVLLSSYKREMAVGCIFTSLDDFIRRFIEGRMSHWGSWQSHAESWINSPLAASGNLLVVRYEDMRKDPERTVRQSLEFFGKSAEASVIQAAIRNNSLERMRDKEQRSKRMVKIKGDGRQVNSGMIERWRTMLTPQQLAMVDEYAGKMRERFGYPTGAGSLSAKHNAPEIGPRLWESRSHEQRGGNFTGRGLQKFSPIDLENAEHPAAHRNLRVRVGGRIANLFSWYPY